MKKSLIALAVAGVFVAPVAMADTSNVIIYGIADLAVGSTDNGVVSATQVSSQVSKLGFKGSGDLGDGLSAIWQIEQQIDMDNTSAAGAKNTFGTRNTFAGLKSESMGTVLLGRHDTPYKIATRKLDVFVDQLATNYSLMGGGSSATNGAGLHIARLTDELVYISPKMNNFTVAAAIVAGAETATTAAQQKGSAYSLAAMYDAAPFYATLAYESFKYGSAGTGTFGAAGAVAAGDTQSATQLGLGYTMDALQLNLVYENNKSSVAGLDSFGRANLYLGGKYSFGNDDVKLAYTTAGKIGGVANTGAKQISIGYDHSLNKRTTLYTQYTKISNQSGANFGITSAGSTAGGAAVALGNSPSGYAFGMKHVF